MKFKCLITFIFSIIVLYSNLSNLNAQEAIQIENRITSEKKRLLILSSKIDDQDTYSIDKEVASVITNVATQLGRFEVIDRNNLQSILDEQALQLTGVINDSMVVSIGNIAAAREAFVITVTNFFQKGVPKQDEDKEDEDDASFWEKIIGQLILEIVKGLFTSESQKTKEDPYWNNIQTQLSVQVDKINIETGQSLRSFNIDVGHTGGTRGKSRAKVIKKLRKQTIQELKTLYLLTTEVISVDNGEVLLLLGADIGVRKGTVFEIVKPDQIRKFKDKTITVPGRRAGFVSAEDISAESNRSIILRQWRTIQSGDKALEQVKPIYGLQVNFIPPLDTYYSLGIQAHVCPLQKRDWGFGLRFIQITDSFNDKDNGFGFSAFGAQRFLNTSKLALLGRLGLDFDFASRKDDEDHTVTTLAVSAHLGINAEILISEKSDLVISAGYRFGGKSSNWQYSEGEDEDIETHPVVWNNDSPEVNISGFFLTLGYKFIFF